MTQKRRNNPIGRLYKQNKQLNDDIRRLRVAVVALFIAFTAVYVYHYADESVRDIVVVQLEKDSQKLLQAMYSTSDLIKHYETQCYNSEGFWTGNNACRELEKLYDKINDLSLELDGNLIKLGAQV